MSDDEVSRPEVRKGRGNLPVTHLTTGEREELAATAAGKHLYWPRADGLGRGNKPVTPDTTGTEQFKPGHDGWGYHALKTGYFQIGAVTPDAEEKTRQNDAEESRGEKTRQNDAENVTPKRDDQRDDQRDDPRDTIWPYQRDTTAFISGYKAGFAEGYEDCKKNMLSLLSGSGAFASD